MKISPLFADTPPSSFPELPLDRENPNGVENEASAFGGWAGYKSGWLFDVFGIGATYYGSTPLHAPADKDGSLLLKPGRKGYSVFGEAYAALRYKNYIQVKGYRQVINQPYITLIDNRMTPNTSRESRRRRSPSSDYLAGTYRRLSADSTDFVYIRSRGAREPTTRYPGHVRVTRGGAAPDAGATEHVHRARDVYGPPVWVSPLPQVIADSRHSGIRSGAGPIRTRRAAMRVTQRDNRPITSQRGCVRRTFRFPSRPILPEHSARL